MRQVQTIGLNSAQWLANDDTQAVFAALAVKGWHARAVGGAVRNALMGEPVADVDIATDAYPDAVMSAASDAGLKWIGTGLSHGTITVLSGGIPYEVTTLRIDLATDGRHAQVGFTNDWVRDASRRDFTVNALYCDADGTVFDPLSGYTDVLERRIRFIGDAKLRIAEDYLRILRFFRLHAELGKGPMDRTGLVASLHGRHGLKGLSAERIAHELRRLLVAPGAVVAIGEMFGWGILTEVLPSAPRLTAFNHVVASEKSLGNSPDAMLRLTALAVHVTEDIERLAVHLRLSNVERERLALILLHTGMGRFPDTRDARKLLYQLGRNDYRAVITYLHATDAISGGDIPGRELVGLPDRWSPPEFCIKGSDLINMGMAPGPTMGTLLRSLEQNWIASDFQLERDALLKTARAAIK